MSIIKLNEVYKPKNSYKVIVKTITFNQSKYIEDTLNGIAMQNTNFPFVNVVLEDNSSDGEQEIIKIWLKRECDMSLAEYYDIPTADVIIAPHSTNPNCTFAIYFHKENLFQQKAKREEQIDPWRTKSEYEALCEGDDYWIDPLKLQKQVDFLEGNPDYSFVCHRYNIYEQNTGLYLKEYAFDYYKEGEDLEITLDLYSRTWVTQTLTTVMRTDVYMKVYSILAQYRYSRDVHLYYHLLKEGKGISLNRNMGVYRWHDGGVASPLRGTVRYMLAYNIYKELYETNRDSIFKYKLVDNICNFLKYKHLSRTTFSMLKEGLMLADSMKMKIKLFLAAFFPIHLYLILAKFHGRLYRRKITLKL